MNIDAKYITRISQTLKRNEYPDHIVNRLIKQVIADDTKEKNSSTQKIKKYYLTLPYISEQLCRNVFYTLRKQQLLDVTKVTFTPGI